MTICSTCNGVGQAVHPSDTWRPLGDPQVRVICCEDCGGTGTTEEAVALVPTFDPWKGVA